MKPYIAILLIFQVGLCWAVRRPEFTSNNNTVLNVRLACFDLPLTSIDHLLQFDDVTTVKGLSNVPSPYFHLSFSRYNVLSPRDTAWKGKISEDDLNCAVSAPNALIGSRYQSDSTMSSNAPEGAYFQVANASSLAENGVHPHFTLLSFNIKPLAAPSSNTSITVKGYSHARQDILTWKVDFASDYHEPLLVKIQEFSRKEWSQLYGVEILADYGEDALDWEFCLDDLQLQFFKVAEEEVINRRLWYQKVLKSVPWA